MKFPSCFVRSQLRLTSVFVRCDTGIHLVVKESCNVGEQFEAEVHVDGFHLRFCHHALGSVRAHLPRLRPQPHLRDQRASVKFVLGNSSCNFILQTQTGNVSSHDLGTCGSRALSGTRTCNTETRTLDEEQPRSENSMNSRQAASATARVTWSQCGVGSQPAEHTSPAA